jgi:hypothetical protein
MAWCSWPKTLKGLETYYAAIRAAAAQIRQPRREADLPQGHLRKLLQGLQPKAADRLGVVYTPNEIVRFMIEGADWLCREAFRQKPDRPGRGNPRSRHRHRHLHLRTARTLPRPAQKLAQVQGGTARQRGGHPAVLRGQPQHRGHLRRHHRQYAEFPSLCFVDTLDNVALHIRRGHQHDLFGMSATRTSSASSGRTAQDQRHHRQPALQRQPGQRKRQQQEPRLPAYRQIDQGTYIARAPRRRPSSTTCTPASSAGPATGSATNGVLAFITNRSFIE